MEDEMGFHVVVRCTKVVALRRQEMRSIWLLPGEEQFRHSGPDWLLLLLSSVSKDMGDRLLLLFWRAWHLRNDLVHGDGQGSIIGSSKFLESYYESLNRAIHDPQDVADDKGKGKM
jgi:hypothetical protein